MATGVEKDHDGSLRFAHDVMHPSSVHTYEVRYAIATDRTWYEPTQRRTWDVFRVAQYLFGFPTRGVDARVDDRFRRLFHRLPHLDRIQMSAGAHRCHVRVAYKLVIRYE